MDIREETTPPQRQRERQETKGLMSRIAVHVRDKSLYISLPPSAKQREMTPILRCLENVKLLLQI